MGVLDGKVAVITGGSGGIGLATAELLGREGAALALLDRDEAGLARAADHLGALGPTCLTRVLDVRNYDAVEAACEAAEQRFGGIDILVNVAGGGLPQTIATTSPDDWEGVVSLNLSGPFNGIKACADRMRRRGGGSIVTVASLASLTMSMNFGASYTASKAGVLGLTRHAAFELARDGIRVNAVLPGPVLTPLTQRATPESVADVLGKLPLGRWITPAEIAAPILFFCTPGAAACTGTHLVVDGGLAIGSPTGAEAYFKSRDAREARGDRS